MKAMPCEIIFNTAWGYCLTPIKCKSIAEAKRKAVEYGMAYRIIVGGAVVARGWIC